MISGFRDSRCGVMIMIGLSMLLGALVLVIILVLVEITVFLWREKPPPKILTRITTSHNLNLTLNELVAAIRKQTSESMEATDDEDRIRSMQGYLTYLGEQEK